MQDKLIEEMAKALWVSWGVVLERPGWETFAKTELGENYRKGCLAVLAVVRAHDAETDEEVIAYRARQIWRRFVGIPITEPYTAEFQWLLDLLSGNEAPKKTLTEAVQEARGNLEPPTVPIRFASPASHAAESAAPSLTCACCGNETPTLRSVGIMPDMCEPCAKHAESAQLDAEDPAEPVEDVVSRMCELMGGCACEHCIKRMTAALAVANQVRDDQWEATVKTQYYSADVIGFPAYIQAIKARLAPKPSPDPIEEVIATAICNECGARVGKRELHLKWHAALFPKTGGAK